MKRARIFAVALALVALAGVGSLVFTSGAGAAGPAGAYQWHTFYGSALEDRAYSVAVDGANNAYIVGRGKDTWNGPAGEEPINGHSGPGRAADFYVLKLDSAGEYQWHTFFGVGYGPDFAYSVAVDAQGDVYVTGFSYSSWDGPNGEPPKHEFQGGEKDVFVLKLDSAGEYQWHTFYGSADYEDEGQGIALDADANVYVAVKSYGTWNGPEGVTPLHDYSGGADAGSQTDMAVLKLDSDGEYVWHTFYGSDAFVSEDDPGEEPTSIAVDSNSNVYVGGFCISTWQGPAAQEPKHAFTGGSNDAFVLKLDGEGGYQWHTLYGSTDKDWANGIDVNGGDVYVAGFSGASWDGPTGQAPLHAYSGGHDLMVLKLDGSGSYAWHTFYGSAEANDYGLDIVHDNRSGILVVGRSLAGWQGDDGTDPLHGYTGAADVVVLGLSDSGEYRRHTFYGGAGDDLGQGIALDGAGSGHVVGYSAASWDGPAGQAPLHLFTAGDPDAFDLLLTGLVGTVPTVSTLAADALTSATALSGGCVRAQGDDCVTARGVCWSTSKDPTTANAHTVNGAGMGAFLSILTGLSPGVTYHYRAYATNSAGTGYGNDLTVTTPLITPRVTHTVIAEVIGGHGTATPAEQPVRDGGSASIDIDPEPGYRIGSILDNGVAQPIVDPYVIDNVRLDHRIQVAFTLAQIFPDVSPAQQYFLPIQALAVRGVVKGLADGNFHPSDPLIREQFAKMVVLALGLTVTGQEQCPFGDVSAIPEDAEDPCYPAAYVAVCAREGIVKGTTATTFAPYANLSRQHMISMITRAANPAEPPAGYVPPFTRSQFASAEHYANARRAAYAGLLDGLQAMDPGYDFAAIATRGECAQVLWNLSGGGEAGG
jgi:hypothetical protein